MRLHILHQIARPRWHDRAMRIALIAALTTSVAACGGGSGDDGPPLPLPAPACAPEPGGGSATVAMPTLTHTIVDRWHEGWLASPAVVDLDGDGTPEIVLARGDLVVVWRLDGAGGATEVWRQSTAGRVWSSPVVADLVPGRAGLEVAVASRGQIHVWDAAGAAVPGFPVAGRDEMRSLAAGDIDGDGALELVAVTTSPLSADGRRDIIVAIEATGAPVAGFPANTTGGSGCDDACYVTGGYDQNVTLGDVDGDGVVDILATQDNAYLSLHDGTGRAFDAAPIFRGRTKFPGIRFMVDYRLAQQGYADDEAVDEQGHFTNSAAAIADLDGDGQGELIVLGSVQNAGQDDRERGVAVWVVRHDGTRPAAWEAPPRMGDYLWGLWDVEGTNVVGITNQVAVADLDPDRPGPEIVFAGFDGRVWAVDARAETIWSHRYTDRAEVGTGGVVIADLSGDGVAEIVLATYSPTAGRGELIVLDAAGNRLHTVPLPDRGAMPVPTIADADGDGTLDIVVSTKGGQDGQPQALVFEVAGATANCLAWPTGRGNLRRDGYLPPP
jgi:hypothetical protein